MNPTREDLIELGYLKPGDTLARAPKRERKLFLTESDLEYAEPSWTYSSRDERLQRRYDD